jgi:hypothetical protein
MIPEAYPLAYLAMQNCGLSPDAIVDEDSAPYPSGQGYEIEELTTEGYASLLRIERGRVRHREIFGPLRLHYGLFKLQSRRSTYLIARETGRVMGAVGFTLDPVEKTVRIFELIVLHDDVVRVLLSELERFCRLEWSIIYIEADVSAYAPRMQRTLLELNFLPAAYVPALAFYEVERLDVIKMVRLLVPVEENNVHLSPKAAAIAGAVLKGFFSRSVLPRVATAVRQVSLFSGLNPEQVHRLAGVCSIRTFDPGERIFTEGEIGSEMFVVLEGEVAIHVGGHIEAIGRLRAGECLGEISLITGAGHSATACALTAVETAVLNHKDLVELVRLRPDIGVLIYRNLAIGLGEKLKRSDQAITTVLPASNPQPK